MTEASGLIASNPIPPGLRKEGSVGIAAGPEVRILGESLEPAATLEHGEVVVRGQNVITEYERPAEANAPAFVGPWMRTGDRGYLDEDGYLFLTDRKAYMIISGGVNIYPQETENLLITPPKVADAAVFGVPNEDLGEEVKAIVQAMPGVTTDEAFTDELLAFCREHLSRQKVPRSIEYEDELPRLPTGKLYKRLLRDRYWNDPGATTTSKIV